MKLPNYKNAVISQTKITGYLLSIKHRNGRSKAEFFTQLGFSYDAWEDLVKALLQHAADNDVTKIEDSLFGTRYIIEGLLFAPGGRQAIIRSVWFIETGEDIPRFVTAYPLQRRT
ncbi:MAG: hypothetical protein COS40_06225 [Deltaproteobacteria bacterium CG03_land_8_20_14_0_80_45_14]|nr:MAG: hypothetical protein COS40_06225 [Deltaproteobacteria bacterium CG03_land_8_20_14_0_80_45_14]